MNLFEVKSPDYTVLSLVCTVEGSDQRVSGHGVPVSLIQKQAASLEMPLLVIPLPDRPSNPDYEKAWTEATQPLIRKKKLEGIAFGDIHLEDVRKYRDELLQKLGLKGFYPLWKWESKEVLRVFFSLGYRAIVTAVSLKSLPPTFVGRDFDQDFIADLPSGVDPCGENGEFHTFVYDGPFFQRTVDFKKASIFEKNGYAIQDLES